mgnify:FL=1|tara:strand:+ start:1095 stop:1778 length:684 start_codon:yes stop_codon:yes gene_type:complete
MSNLNYVINNVENTNCDDEPWSHLIIKNFLPQNLYQGVCSELESFYSNPILSNHGIRAYHIFVNQSVNVYPKTPYLKEYYDILTNDKLIDTIGNKLNVQQKPKDFYSELNLFTRGYVYDEVHPDRDDKLFTMLHYLADDGDDESLGTFLYTPHKKGSQLSVYGDIEKSSPYIKNCVLFFSPKNGDYQTNHCMGNRSEKTFLRKSFQTFYIKEPSDWTKDPQKGRHRI